MTSNNTVEYTVDELSIAIESNIQLATLPPSVMSSSATAEATTTRSIPAEVLPITTSTTPAATTTTTATTNNNNNKYDRWTLVDDTTIDYGYLHKTGGIGISSTTKNNSFYLTTAINYTNGPAHMGHAYEAITSDVIVRFKRLLYTNYNNNDNDNSNTNYPVYFVTGSDEHGQKIAQTATEQNKLPIDICNLYVTGFQVLNQRIRITNDDYIRTTSIRHKLCAHELWKRCHNDIYIDTYSGWYNVREETFVPDNEALLCNYIDIVSGLPLKKVEEESYFFKMSKYKNQLIHYIELDNPTFIQPEMHKNLILQRLKSDELRDLSISRTTFNWGIQVPDPYNANHVMYVWVDALSNYLTGINAFQQDTDDDNSTSKELYNFWPASVHIIGKDILWFHTVIWPCLLMSANLPLPKIVFAHGFINDKDGKKMSKSLGNVIDPHDMLDKYSVDTFRWYLCKEVSFGGELSFNELSLCDMHNADLCDNIGNLLHRAATLCSTHCSGIVPDIDVSTSPILIPVPLIVPINNVSEILQLYIDTMNTFDLQGGTNIAIQVFRDINGYLQSEEPWKKKGDDYKIIRQLIIRQCLEAIYIGTHMLLPYIPDGCTKIFTKLNTKPISLIQLLNKSKLQQPELAFCRYLKSGTIINVGSDVLYTKTSIDGDVNNNDSNTGGSKGGAASSGGVSKKETFADAQKRKKEAKEKIIAAQQQKNNNKTDNAAANDNDDDDPDRPDFTKLDIRVGKISKVWYHPDADKLFCEQINVGDTTTTASDNTNSTTSTTIVTREIASGLRDYYTLQEMENRLVLVVCNLKPAKIVGFTSNGMVLAAKGTTGNTNIVELIDPPQNSIIGERVFIDNLEKDITQYVPVTSTQVKKKKLWETVASNLKTSTTTIQISTDDNNNNTTTTSTSAIPATWMGRTLRTSAGICTVPTLLDTPIS